jgi:hypothetical protein
MYGRKSIMDNKYRNLKQHEKDEILQQYLKLDKINIEIVRLRSKALFVNTLQCLEYNERQWTSDNSINIMFYKLDMTQPVFMNVLRSDYGVKDSSLAIVFGTSIHNLRFRLPEFDRTELEISGMTHYLNMSQANLHYRQLDPHEETTYRSIYLNNDARDFEIKSCDPIIENGGVMAGFLALQLKDRQTFWIMYMSNESADRRNNIRAWEMMVELTERSKHDDFLYLIIISLIFIFLKKIK